MYWQLPLLVLKSRNLRRQEIWFRSMNKTEHWPYSKMCSPLWLQKKYLPRADLWNTWFGAGCSLFGAWQKDSSMSLDAEWSGSGASHFAEVLLSRVIKALFWKLLCSNWKKWMTLLWAGFYLPQSPRRFLSYVSLPINWGRNGFLRLLDFPCHE